MKTDVIINRDALYALRELPSESVNCCVTSPPYYGLRDYGLDAQIGREDTPEQYIGRLVEVFRELRRVLKDDGTLWLNIADTYCGTGMKAGCKQKDLIGIPWLLAFADAMHSLPEEKRQAVLLYYFFSMTDAEIAELMKVPRSTVQYRRTSSFELLKRYLEERADEWNEL